MTEEEAKTKWCPFVRTIGEDDPGTVNRWTLDEGGVPNPFGGTNFCIGSACMAYRIDHVDIKNDGATHLKKPAGELNPPFSNCPEGYTVTVHDSDGYFHAEKNPRHIEHGFCGLAGKP